MSGLDPEPLRSQKYEEQTHLEVRLGPRKHLVLSATILALVVAFDHVELAFAFKEEGLELSRDR